jgi:hypothetical protein
MGAMGKKRYQLVSTTELRGHLSIHSFRIRDTQSDRLMDVIFSSEEEALAFLQKINDSDPPTSNHDAQIG